MATLDRIARLPLPARFAGAFVAIAITTAAAALYGADVAQAALFLLVGVLVAALGGRRVGVATAIVAAVVLNAGFTPPRWTLRVGNADDAIALVVFTVVGVAVGSLMSAASESRRSAERRARTAELALQVTGMVQAGAEPMAVAARAAAAVRTLFGLEWLRLAIGDLTVVDGAPPRDAPEPVAVEAPGARLEVAATEAASLSADDLAVLRSLVAQLAGALEQQRLEREAEAARVDVAVSRTRALLLSTVSHNLRTPLAAMHAAVSTLLDPRAVLDDEARHELLDTVRDETVRLERLVAKVLDLGRIRAGGLELAPEPIDLGGLVQAAVHRLHPLIGTRAVRVEVADDVADVQLDPGAMEQMMLNLLENALRHTPDGTPVEILATRIRGQVELRVVDHGPGVAPDERERVFDEFYRGARPADTEGTGLGLAIVHALVVAQRGRVWVDETRGGGATFVVRLPRVMEAATA